MRKNLRAVRLQLGKTVQELRRARGWSQERLAEAAGHSHKVIGQIERGEANVTIDILAAIAAGLSIDVGDLFARSPDRGGPHHVVVLTRQDVDGLSRLVTRLRNATRAPRRRPRRAQD